MSENGPASSREGSHHQPQPSPKGNSKNNGDKNKMDNIWAAFFLGEQFADLKKNWLKRILQFGGAGLIGLPFFCGVVFRVTISYRSVFGLFTKPASAAGVALNSAFTSATSALLNEEGKPYPYADAEVKQVGTGVTLSDVKAKPETGE